MVTREKILERLAKLKAEREQLIANLNAYNGAIQDCEYWLSVLEDGENNDLELQHEPGD